MLFANSFECVQFPVTAALRNPKVHLEVTANGQVNAICSNRNSSTAIASCDPSSSRFRSFIEFWAVIVPQCSRSALGITQLVMDLAAGRLRQDADCPCLFLDLTRKETLSDGAEVAPLVHVRMNGAIVPYDPDGSFLNEAFALCERPDIKFFTRIEEFDGNEFPVGVNVGWTREPGTLPAYHAVSNKITKAAIEAAADKCPAASAEVV